jgi:hypothetical protein
MNKLRYIWLMREVNLGLSRLLTAVFKLSNEAKMELFYKENEKSLYPAGKRPGQILGGIELLR